MNYLAHAYLSFGHPQLLVGNMISDFVKGKSQYAYERQIGMGIRLHRSIDAFTDSHPATAAAKEIFRPHYRLYSGAMVDVLYDHFLANDTHCFADEAQLFRFSQEVYQSLDVAKAALPLRFQQLLPYMQSQNWLYHYKDREGMAKSLQGLVRRAAYLSDAQTAFRLFEEHYNDLQTCYDNFIEDVKSFAKEQVAQLLL
jgi:acyl carrier protein phosphodiesterase